jgi:ABC-type multidrug transport system fused ATPase/permease subunit
MPKAHRLFLEILLYRPWSRALILVSSLCAASFGLLAPYFQKEFIDALLGATSHRIIHIVDTSNPIFLIIAAFASLLIAQGFSQLTNYLGYREAVIMQRRLSEKLYDKMLSLRIDTMSQRPVGEVVSIYATDVPGATMVLEQTLPSGASTLFPLILAPFALSLVFSMPFWPTISLMLFVATINTGLAFRQSRYFFQYKHLGAKRIGLVNEWIQNIRTIRILGWIPFFERQILKVREIETDNRVSMVTNGQVMNSISTSVTFALNVVTLASLVFLSTEKLTPGEIMALLWVLTVFLTRPFRQMPWFFTMGFDAITSIKRLQDFLATQNEHVQTHLKTEKEEPSPSASLEVKDLNLTINGKKILENLNFEIKPGEFIAVVGEVGAGKSMLLYSLLRETGAHFKKYFILGKNALEMSVDEVRKKYSFVPQEGFIMSASLRDNVSFLYDTPEESDETIVNSLKLAQFDLSREDVSLDLETEIGERGVNLSGGQKQRVSLARVNYLSSDILLLDDCLSALDVNTEELLLESLLQGAWKDRTRILVTHRLSVLPHVDRILFMSKGKIVRTGTFTELVKDEEFRNYTRTVQSTEGGNDERTRTL